jgi:hypothetical protein
MPRVHSEANRVHIQKLQKRVAELESEITMVGNERAALQEIRAAVDAALLERRIFVASQATYTEKLQRLLATSDQNATNQVAESEGHVRALQHELAKVRRLALETLAQDAGEVEHSFSTQQEWLDWLAGRP